MATLFEKLSGKAPWKDDDENVKASNAESSNTDKNDDKKAKKSASNNKPKAYDVNDIKTVAIWAIPIAVCGILAICSKEFAPRINAERVATINNQVEQIRVLENNISTKSNEYKAMKDTVNNLEDAHFYDGDTSDDRAIAENFFNHFCTWSDGATYESLRNELINDYGYSPDSSVVTCLLAEQMNDTIDYTKYYAIDTYGYNLKFETLEDYPLAYNTSDVSSSYAGILTVSTVDKSLTGRNKTTFIKILVTYSIRGDSIEYVEATRLVD